MSLFAMGYNQLEVNEAKLTMAELELDSLTSMFNKYVFSPPLQFPIPFRAALLQIN